MLVSKHAYLIIAHNQPRLLQLQVDALDDCRNDIYIHFDKKSDINTAPKTQKAGLFIVNDRISVYWGDYSQVQTELILFETAYSNQSDYLNYSYYHLLSGVDYPLKSQDYIHEFCKTVGEKEFIGFYQGDDSNLRRKVGLYHLFPTHFSKERRITFMSLLRAAFIRVQLLCGIKRNSDLELKKGTNWCSVTNSFVRFLLENKNAIKRRFRWTFCPDEVYKHTLCWNSSFRDKIFDPTDEAIGCMREINWVITSKGSYLPSFSMSDYPRLVNSPAFFARKFDESEIDLIYKLRDLL